jgi:ABC-2 type transport system permease protein
MAMAFSDYIAHVYTTSVTMTQLPLTVDFQSLGTSRTLSDFDLYVPALLVLALIMVLFTAAATLIKEVDKGTMSRLMLSQLTTPELLTAVSFNQVIIGVSALLLAFLAALSVGYKTEGSLLALLIVGAISALSVVAISVLVAAFLKSIFELLTIGCFPFFILMFFSDVLFPLPKITLFHLAGNIVYLNDILPTTLTVSAFNGILNYGAGLDEVIFELGAILLLTAFYFALGSWFFQRRHQRV